MTSKVYEKVHVNGRLRSRKYKLNGVLHRTDGPAWEQWDDDGRLFSRSFWVNDELHRTDGPAWEEWDKKGRFIYREFWINNEELTEKDFLAWQHKQRQRELAALVFALEHKFPADAPEREFLRHILPAFVAGEAAT